MKKAFSNSHFLLIVLVFITNSTLSQWGLVVIDKNEFPPLNQWYTVAKKKHNSDIFFLGDRATCNDLLDRHLEPHGEDHTTGVFEDGAFRWLILIKGGEAHYVSLSQIEENWQITVNTFFYNEESADPSWLTDPAEAPFGVITLRKRQLGYYTKSWCITQEDKRKGYGYTHFLGTIEECEQQLDAMLSDFGLDWYSGEPVDGGFIYDVKCMNGYNMFIYYHKLNEDELSSLVMMTAPIDYSEECAFLGIVW